MRTQEYVLAGKEVPAKFRGTKVALRAAETWQEAVTLANGNETQALGIFNDAFVIYQQGRMRRKAAAVEKANDPNGAATLQSFAGQIVHEKTATGTPKTAKPKTLVKSAAAASGNRMFEKMLSDEGYRQRAIEGGFAEESEFNAWLAARKAAAAQPATPTGNGVGNTPAATPTPAAQPNIARRPAGAGGGKK